MTRPTLIGLPYDSSSSFARGAAQAPPRIRQALWSPIGNPFSESLVDLSAPGVLADAGDLDLVGLMPSQSAEARRAIEEGIARVVAAGGTPIALGGDHSVTYPIVRALRPHAPRLTILHVDAHPDLNDVFEGDRYSHACPFARIFDERLADHLVQIGIRVMSKHQREQADKFGVDVIDMRRWAAGDRPVWNQAVEGPVYLSIDLDGLDPAFAPGVAHREPGGLSVRDVLTEIQRLSGPIVGADIVEYNPMADENGRTAPVAAKLVKELASRMIELAGAR